ncbi:hypothetical protein Emed_000888 [Eimeria media]
MGVLRCIVLAGVSVLCLKTGCTDASSSPTFTYNAARVNCRPAMNAVRSKADLPNFGEPSEENKLPIKKISDYVPNQAGSPPSAPASGSGQAGANQSKDNFLESVCQAVMSTNGAPPAQEKQAEGTYMYAPQGSPEEMCSSAVEFWSEAITHFPSLPPAYSKNENLYKNERNVSFVGLYNPNPNPTVDCAIITCQLQIDVNDEEQPEKLEQTQNAKPVAAAANQGTETAAGDRSSVTDQGQDEASPTVAQAAPLTANPSAESQSNEAEGSRNTAQMEDGERAANSRRLSDKPNAVYSLLCLSRPPALTENQMPFT